MRGSAVFFPADQVFGGEPGGHHQELKVEPIRLEPEKQVDAEDHREWTEAQGVGVPPRPREQHLEPIGEKELGGNEIYRAVDLTPVPPPIQQYGSLSTCLEVVLPARHDLDDQDAARTFRRRKENGAPQGEYSGRQND